jgi:hypothetical protein
VRELGQRLDAWGPGARVDPALRRLVAQCVLSGPSRARARG